MAVAELATRLAISFITLLVLTRIIGRKEISQMTFFNFVSAISIGTIGASLAIDSSISIRNGVIALVAWCLFTIILGLLSIKSKSVRNAVTGQPLLLVRKGQIVGSALRKARLDLDSFRVMLRKQNVYSLADVDYAIFETNGKLSVLKKELQQNATRMDVSYKSTEPSLYPLPFPVISDGQFDDESLAEYGVDRQKIQQLLGKNSIDSVKDVFYAEMQKDGTLYISKRTE